jgi:hypothetical protein
MSVGPDPESWQDDDADDPGLDINVLRRRRELVLGFLALFVVLGIGFFVAGGVYKPERVERNELISAAKDAIKNAAPAGATLQFSTERELVIERQDDRAYLVRGEVLLVMPSAGSTRYFFVCHLKRQENGPWLPAQLSISPV